MIQCLGVVLYHSADPGRMKLKGREIFPKNCTITPAHVHFSNLQLTLTLPVHTFQIIKNKKTNEVDYIFYISELLLFPVYNLRLGYLVY